MKRVMSIEDIANLAQIESPKKEVPIKRQKKILCKHGI
jgi:hypothetical protein